MNILLCALILLVLLMCFLVAQLIIGEYKIYKIEKEIKNSELNNNEINKNVIKKEEVIDGLIKKEEKEEKIIIDQKFIDISKKILEKTIDGSMKWIREDFFSNCDKKVHIGYKYICKLGNSKYILYDGFGDSNITRLYKDKYISAITKEPIKLYSESRNYNYKSYFLYIETTYDDEDKGLCLYASNAYQYSSNMRKRIEYEYTKPYFLDILTILEKESVLESIKLSEEMEMYFESKKEKYKKEKEMIPNKILDELNYKGKV